MTIEMPALAQGINRLIDRIFRIEIVLNTNLHEVKTFL
jgi:hypothetical protein